MFADWEPTRLESVGEVQKELLKIRGNSWLSRGQSRRHGNLLPSIDRKPWQKLDRHEKLDLERRSIDQFRSTARFFNPGEEQSLNDDVTALLVLRHYGLPTRVLDWSRSPYVAAYFASSGDEGEDGEIWCFDEPRYEIMGKEQWKTWRKTTRDNSGDPDRFEAGLTAFLAEEPPDWFICVFYDGFPRQNAQQGAYSMTARFGRNHAHAIAELLGERSRYRLYIIPSELKPALKRLLREEHGIWRGSLFPDSAGAADTAHAVFRHTECPMNRNPRSAT